MQLHYPWIHDIQVHMNRYVEKMGEEFPSLYFLTFFGTY